MTTIIRRSAKNLVHVFGARFAVEAHLYNCVVPLLFQCLFVSSVIVVHVCISHSKVSNPVFLISLITARATKSNTDVTFGVACPSEPPPFPSVAGSRTPEEASNPSPKTNARIGTERGQGTGGVEEGRPTGVSKAADLNHDDRKFFCEHGRGYREKSAVEAQNNESSRAI